MEKLLEERERLNQRYKSLTEKVGIRGILLKLTRDYRDVGRSYDRFCRAHGELEIDANKSVYLGAAHRQFSRKLDEFERSRERK